MDEYQLMHQIKPEIDPAHELECYEQARKDYFLTNIPTGFKILNGIWKTVVILDRHSDTWYNMNVDIYELRQEFMSKEYRFEIWTYRRDEYGDTLIESQDIPYDILEMLFTDKK